MACNAWNHPSSCTCGWGGAYYGDTAQDVTRSLIRSYTVPNARCPVCSEAVFFYQSPEGGRVYFDELGPPWPKHPCTDAAGQKSRRRAAAGDVEGQEDDSEWTAFHLFQVHHSTDHTRIEGRIDENSTVFSVTLPGRVALDPPFPAFIRAQPERRGIVDFSTLKNGEPITLRGFLDCGSGDDVQCWLAAESGDAAAQNTVGYMISFSRAKLYTEAAQHEFTTPNWDGAEHWFIRAARSGNVTALNNLGMLVQRRQNAQSRDRSSVGGSTPPLSQELFSLATELAASVRGDDAQVLRRVRKFLTKHFGSGRS